MAIENQNGEEVPEKSVADAEREVRERLDTEQSEADKQKKPSAHKPIVATSGKRQKKLFGGGLIALLLLVALFALGGWAYKHLRSPTKEQPKAATGGSVEAPGLVRKNLGQDANPWESEKETTGNADSEVENTGKNVAAAAEPVRLNKALALSAGNTVRASSTEITRQDDKGNSASNTAAKPLPVPEKTAEADRPAKAHFVELDPDLFIPALKDIPCSMDRRFVSDVGGPFSCTIYQDVYSASGFVKLIRKGTQAIGEYRTGVLKHGQGRVFIIIHKLRTRQKPFIDIPLDIAQAGGELGEAGVSGWIDEHYVERFSGALLVGSIPDVMNAFAGTAGKTDRNTDYTENSREAMAEMAKTTLDNSINIPPTLYKNQGEIINLIVGQDIDMSDVYQLRMN